MSQTATVIPAFLKEVDPLEYRLGFEFPIEEMTHYPQWVAWKKGPVKSDGKFPKIPYSPKTRRKITGSHVDGEYLSKAGTFNEALEAQKELGADGIGFVLSKDDPFVGVDIDGCLKKGGDPGPFVDILEQFDSYTEISPSKTGIRIFCKGELPEGALNNPPETPYEIYDHNRFLTVTGNPYGPPKGLRHAQEAVNWYCENFTGIRKLKDNPKLERPEKSLTEIAKDIERAREALKCVPADDYQTWLHMAFALHSTGAGDWGFQVWDEWSRTSDKYDERDQGDTWASIRGRENGVTLGSLFEIAKQHGWEAKQKEESLQSKQSPPKITPYNLHDIVTAEIPEREYLLRPVVPSQGLVMLYAPRGIGKTYVSLTCALAMAAGAQVFQWEAPTASRVLYVDGEMPGVLMQERIASLVAGMDATIDPENFKLITPDLSGNLPNLATPGGQQIINSLSDSFEVLILDNLSTVLNTGKESGNDEWLAVQGWLLELRRRGKSVLMVHHAGKSGSQRGNSRKEDILDTVISLKRPRDYRGEEGARINFHFDKARGIYGKEVEPFEAKLETTPEGALTWTTKCLEDAEREMVKVLLDEGLSIRQVAEETGLHRSKVARLKKKLQ